MRITAEAKAETRERILAVAKKSFSSDGWEGTTTRSLAEAAGIATGTLFNYFQSKEAIAAELISAQLEAAHRKLQRRAGNGRSLEEELFDLILEELRSLRNYRKSLSSAVESILSPLRFAPANGPGESIRINHLERVEAIIVTHGVSGPLAPVTMQLYWTLYLGVLAYWTQDDSPKQEDTLALLDQSLRLFAASLDHDKGSEV